MTRRPRPFARAPCGASAKSSRATGAAISKQCWGILPKVKELDDYLERNPAARLSEMHPDAVTTAYGPLADFITIARGEHRRA